MYNAKTYDSIQIKVMCLHVTFGTTKIFTDMVELILFTSPLHTSIAIILELKISFVCFSGDCEQDSL